MLSLIYWVHSTCLEVHVSHFDRNGFAMELCVRLDFFAFTYFTEKVSYWYWQVRTVWNRISSLCTKGSIPNLINSNLLVCWRWPTLLQHGESSQNYIQSYQFVNIHQNEYYISRKSSKSVHLFFNIHNSQSNLDTI